MAKQVRSRRRFPLFVIFTLGAGLLASIALADDESDRRGLLSEIESKLGSAVSELAGIKSDSDDGDIRDADGYVDQVRDLISRLDRVKGDDSRAKEVVERYPGYIDRFKRASAALRSMKGYQSSNVTVMKTCQDKNAELVGLARDFESRNDPEGLEKLPRLAADFKNITVRFLEEAEKFRSQMEDWKRAVQYFDVSDGKWSDVRSVLRSESDDLYSYFKSDLDTARERCKDLAAGPDHPVVKEVLGKLANSSAGRKEVMENLMKLMGEMSSRIKDVPGASGTSAVDGVREKLDAIDSTLSILERTKGSDPKAKDIADKWPAIAREARASIEPLRELKTHHHAMDDLPGKCKDMESKLDALIASNGDNAEGIDTIPALATELGNPVIVGLAKAKERLYQMARDRDSVMRFDRSESGWADVKAAYHTSAKSIYDTFEDKHEETLSACQYITRTTEHPKVTRAVDQLKARSGSDIDVLARDVNEWVVSAKLTYRLDCDSMLKMWESYCEIDWEPDDPAEASLAEQTAASLQSTMQAAQGPLLTRTVDLETRGKALARKRLTKDKATELLALVAKEKERLERMFPSDKWHGVNDPLKFYAAEHGKAEHRRMAASFSCDVSDKTFPGSATRPDCVRADGCWIYEFKANDPTAIADGWKQLAGYSTVVTAYYQKHIDDATVPDDEHGGSKIWKAFVDKGCIKDKRISLKIDVMKYEMCERRYRCVEN